MELDFSLDGEVRVAIMDYLKKILSDFPETIHGRVTTPAAYHLFTVRGDSDRKLLGEYWDTAFHQSVTQLLFVTPYFRKYIHTSVAFLTTRVTSPDEDDWQKLRRVQQ